MKNGPVIKVGPGEEFPDNTPKQYIQGWVEFYKLKFKVTPDVLIPRPETELLVDEVLSFILRPSKASGEVEGSRLRSNNKRWTILDVGTGAGNIAISTAKNAPNVRVFATDISQEALEVARENAKRNRVENKIFFIQSDLLNVIASERSERGNLLQNKQIASSKTPRNDDGFSPDVIVTNLPYIPSSRIPYLDPSVKDFEPRVALDGGSDGFELYRKLFDQIRHKFLSKVEGVNLDHLEGGLHRHPPSVNKLKLIVCEIDYTHGELAIQEAQKLVVSEVEPYFPKAKVEVKTDLAQKQRILIINI